MIKSRIVQILFVFLTAVVCLHAQVYPVAINGSLMMPVSSGLTDLSGVDAQKLMYNVMLNDPIDASLEVYFKVVIKNNNRVIMESNPSITTVRKTLLNAQMTAMTGSDFATLFKINNLIGKNGFGVTNSLPKGMNSICIQAISTRNNQIVSNQGCASGLFQDLQVPVIELPKCSSSFKTSENQNIQFKWAPRHIGSSNAPSMVTYELEMKEMPPGAISPADVFASATLFLKRTVNTSSFLLSDTDAKLVPGKTYAWRVRVQSAMGGSYFLNNGYSEYCSFTVLNIGQINVPSCSSGLYETSIVSGVGSASESLQIGQKIKVGYFDLEIKEATKSGSGYNGKGLIYVPFLKANLNVTFSDLRANGDLRAHTVGEMKAVADVEIELAKISATSSTADVDKAITATVASLVDGDPSKRMTINRSETDRTPIGTPMIFGAKDSDGKSLPSMIVSSIRFGPRKATVDLAMSPPIKESDAKANFWKRDVPILPSGIPANPQLDLVSDMIIPMGEAGEIVIKQNTTESNATKARCDCDGFNTFVIQGKYKMPKEFINLNDKTKPLYGNFSARSRHWGNLILELNGLEKFGLTTMQDFVFGTEKVVLDFSSTASISDMKTPEGYPEIKKEWLGLYLPNMKVTIPKSFTGSKELKFTGENILLDNDGLYAKLNGKELLKMGDGKIGSWGFGIEEININIAKFSIGKSYILGGLQLPIMTGNEAMPYKATFVNNTETEKYDLKFAAVPKDIQIALIGSSISFDTTSVIDIERKDGSFSSPKVNLSGTVKFDLKPTGYVGESAEYYTKFQKLAKDNNLGNLVPVFKSEGFKFKDFIIDLSREGNKFGIGEIEPSNSSLVFLGTTANLADVKFGEVDSTKVDKEILAKLGEGERALGFTFETLVAQNILGGLAPKVSIGFYLKEKTAADGSVDYDFLNYGIKMEKSDANVACNSNMKPVEISNTNAYSGAASDLVEVKVGRFRMKPHMSSLQYSEAGLSGTGVVEVGVLGPLRFLTVAFENVKINSDKQVYEGSIMTKTGDSGLFADTNVKGLVGNALKKVNSTLNSALKLPVVLGKTNEDGYSFIFSGLEFGPKKTSLSARLVVDLGNDNYAQFKAEGLNVVPTGISGANVRMSLDKAFSYKMEGMDIPLVIDAYSEEDTTGSYVACDCDGFKNFNLTGALKMPVEYIKSKQGLKNPDRHQVIGKFSMNTKKWGDFMGELAINDTIYIPDLEDMPMYMSSVKFDLSDDRNPENLDLEKLGSKDLGMKWKGIYIPEMQLKIPESISSMTSDAVAMVTGSNIVFSNKGFTGAFRANNLMSADKASIGGMGASVDTIVVNFVNNGLDESKIIGGLQLPIMNDKEAIPYVADMTIAKDSVTKKNFLDFKFTATPGEVDIDMLKSKFTFNDKSSISITRKNGKFEYPIVDLSGKFEISIPDLKKIMGKDIEEQIDLLESLLNVKNVVPEFQLGSIDFEHFKINPNDTVAFGIKSITPKDVGIKFVDLDWGVEEIKFDELKNFAKKVKDAKDHLTDKGTKDEVKELALGFNFGKGPFSVDFRVKINEERKKDKKISYSFKGFDFKFNKPSIPKFKCEVPKELTNLDETEGELKVKNVIKAGGFDLTINELNGSKGKGTVKIAFLDYDLKVNFTDLKVNSKGEMLEGAVITDTEESLIPKDLSLTGGKDIPVISSSKALKDFMESAKGVMTLPISLGKQLKDLADLELPDGLDIILVGLSFSKTGAQMNMVVSIPSSIQGQDPIQFGIRGLNISPTGMNLGDLKLFLAEELKF